MKDQRCFEWFVLRGLFLVACLPSNPKDIEDKIGREVILPDGIAYPIPIDDVAFRKIEAVTRIPSPSPCFTSVIRQMM